MDQGQGLEVVAQPRMPRHQRREPHRHPAGDRAAGLDPQPHRAAPRIDLADVPVVLAPVDVGVRQPAIAVALAADQLVEVGDVARMGGQGRDRGPGRQQADRDPEGRCRRPPCRRPSGEHEQERERGQQVAQTDLQIEAEAQVGQQERRRHQQPGLGAGGAHPPGRGQPGRQREQGQGADRHLDQHGDQVVVPEAARAEAAVQIAEGAGPDVARHHV